MGKERALVLGGGGPVGIAWEAGLLAGLADGGVDVSRADLVLGTSAGSFVGALIAGGRDPASLAQAQIDLGRAEAAAPRKEGGAPPPNLDRLLRFFAEAPMDRDPPPEFLAGIGAYAREAKTMDEASFLKTFGSLATGEWPWPAAFACTAVDAENGAFRVWTKDDAVPLAKAVASSCSVPGIFPPIAIADRQWIDGGMRSSTSADKAAGHKRVLIVAVIAGSDRDPRIQLLGKRMERERAAIAAAGGTSEMIAPDDGARAVFGNNLMHAARRDRIAEAGLAQGKREAARIAAFWD